MTWFYVRHNTPTIYKFPTKTTNILVTSINFLLHAWISVQPMLLSIVFNRYLCSKVVVVLWAERNSQLFDCHIWSLVQTMVDCGKRPLSHHIYKISVNRTSIKSFEFKVCNLSHIHSADIKYSLHEYTKSVSFLLHVSFMIHVYVIGTLLIKKILKETTGYA